MTVEIRHLRAFLAIAEELNLTRAAKRLHVTQPALSRTLAQLERELGVRLVDRSTHHVALTDSGVRFETRSFDAVRSFESALAEGGGQTMPLRLGHSWSAGIHLAAIVRRWNVQARRCALVVVRRDDRTAGLTSGAVDAALTRGPLDGRRFRSVVIDQERRLAVLPSDHPLARKRTLSLDELSREPLVATTVGVTTPALWRGPTRPTVALEVDTVDDWLVAIATGVGFGVTVASTAQLHPHPDVRYVPLADAGDVPLFLAWPKQGQSHPGLAELREAAMHPVGSST